MIKSILIYFLISNILVNYANISNFLYIKRCWHILVNDDFFKNLYPGISVTILGICYCFIRIQKIDDLEIQNNILANKLNKLNLFVIKSNMDGVIDFEKRLVDSTDNEDIFLIKLIPKWFGLVKNSIISLVLSILAYNISIDFNKYYSEIHQFVDTLLS